MNASEFGGSVCLNMLNLNGILLGGHWGLNLAFSSPTPSSEVPEPGGVAIFGLGLLGLGLARRRC